MDQQVPDGDRARKVGDRDPFGSLAHEHLRAGKLGEELGDGVVEQDEAVLEELQHGDGGDGLGHGVDAEDRVGAHGRPGSDILEAHCVAVGELTLAGDEGDRTGKLAALDRGLQDRGDSLQPNGGQTDRFGDHRVHGMLPSRHGHPATVRRRRHRAGWCAV